MKKRSLRILSLVMVLVMLLSVTATSAMAAETDIGKGEQQLHLEALGYETKTLEFATATTEKFSFTTASGIDSTVEKMVLSNGDEVYNVVEGELENTLVVKPNGDIYLDGNLVKITEDAVETGLMAVGDNDLVMPRAQRHEMTAVCPYGTAGDYNRYYNSFQETLQFEKAFFELAEFSFLLVVEAVLFSAGLPALAPAVSTLIGDVFYYYKSNHPLNSACSVYDVGYVHSTLGFTVTSGLSVIKHQLYFYSNTNYTGEIIVNGSRYVTSYETFTY